jgi:ActR/RegA family two-component response regulator
MTPVKRLRKRRQGEDRRRWRTNKRQAKGLPSKGTAGRNGAAKIRVFIADGHHLVRRGLRLVLEDRAGFVLCGEAHNVAEIAGGISTCKPDVVLLGVTVKSDDGLELIEQLHRHFPRVRILVFTMHGNPLIAGRSLDVGASGYLLKTEPTEKIMEAITAVAHGRRYVTASVDPALLEDPTGLEWKMNSGAWVLLDSPAGLEWMLENGDWVVRPR